MIDPIEFPYERVSFLLGKPNIAWRAEQWAEYNRQKRILEIRMHHAALHAQMPLAREPK